jgi:tetratricopeptide (TPR) repeat protein
MAVQRMPGRNEACPCGSGKKYKLCCGRLEPRTSDGGKYREMENAAREIISRRPDSGPAWQMLAVALRNQGKSELEALSTAARLLPDDAAAHNNLANALARLERFDDAVASYRRSLSLKPRFAEASNNLGHVLLALGRKDEALACYRQAVEVKPDFAEAHDNRGNACRELGRFDEAAASHRRALELNSNFPEAHNNLGNTLLDVGRLDDAVVSYRQALAYRPDFAEAHNNLGNALRALGRLDEAMASYRRAVEINPAFSVAHGNLGTVLRLLGRTADAESSCLRALELDPRMAAALAVLAESRADNGQFSEAEDLFRRAISIEPECADAWAGLARLHKMTRADAQWLEDAERIAARGLSHRREIPLRYAIGKYFDDIGDFEQAFVNYRRANELTKGHRIPYDPGRSAQTIDRIIGRHDTGWLARARNRGTPGARPVFVVGMLRSGTTLTEQILASHSCVFGAGELAFWSAAYASLSSSNHDGAPDRAEVEQLAAEYLGILGELSADAPRVVDKMPGNFLLLGLIHAALPEARIIHMRRNPIDTCLSIYFQHLEAPAAYAVDLEDLAHYYGEYARIMNHWRALLPDGAILDVPYEGLVNDQEGWTRKMLEFLDLPWEAQCLEFHRTARAVVTASKWQIRQTISARSVNRWRNYEKFLGPLRGLGS